jgi:hypothetical protein
MFSFFDSLMFFGRNQEHGFARTATKEYCTTLGNHNLYTGCRNTHGVYLPAKAVSIRHRCLQEENLPGRKWLLLWHVCAEPLSLPPRVLNLIVPSVLYRFNSIYGFSLQIWPHSMLRTKFASLSVRLIRHMYKPMSFSPNLFWRREIWTFYAYNWSKNFLFLLITSKACTLLLCTTVSSLPNRCP